MHYALRVAWSAREKRELGGLIGAVLSVPPAVGLAEASFSAVALMTTRSAAVFSMATLVAVVAFAGGLALGITGGRLVVSMVQRLRPAREQL